MAARLLQFRQSVGKVAEQQMRRWVQAVEVQERIEHDAAHDLPETIHPYVAVSREAGAEGGEIALAVSERLGWDILNKDLLDHFAEKYHVPRAMLDQVDETRANWLIEVLGKWINHRVLTQSEYVAHMGHIILMAARHQSTVFVGRGAQYLLPREKGLRVQIVAPLKQRIEHIQHDRNIDRAEAERLVDELDRGRRDFAATYFGHDIGDPHNADIVINRESFSVNDAVDLISGIARKRFDLA